MIEIDEYKNQLDVIWIGGDGSEERITFNTEAGCFSTGHPIGFIVDAIPRYRVHSEGEWLEMSSRPSHWRVEQTNSAHVQVIADGFSVGKFSAAMVFHIYAGTNLLASELILQSPADTSIDTVEHSLQWNNSNNPKPLNVQWYDTIGRTENVYAFVNSSRRRELNAEENLFIYIGSDRDGLAIVLPPHHWCEGFPFYEDSSDEVCTAGCVIDASGSAPFPAGKEKRFLTLYYLNRGTMLQFVRRYHQYVNDYKYRPSRGHFVMMHHLHSHNETCTGKPQLVGKDEFLKAFNVDIALWTEHDCIMKDSDWELYLAQSKAITTSSFLCVPSIEVSASSGCEQVGGKMCGHANYITPIPILHRGQRYEGWQGGTPRIIEEGCLDVVAQKVKAEGGLMWLDHPATSYTSENIADVWTDDFDYIEVSSRKDFHRGGIPNKFDDDFSWYITNLHAALLNAGYKVYLIAGTDFHRGHFVNHNRSVYQSAMVNYVRMDSLTVAELIRGMKAGNTFLTTGEILVPNCQLNIRDGCDAAILNIGLDWTFLPKDIRIFSDTGVLLTYHPQVDTEFSREQFDIPIDLTGRKWIRVEARDMANNLALTQPIFLR